MNAARTDHRLDIGCVRELGHDGGWILQNKSVRVMTGFHFGNRQRRLFGYLVPAPANFNKGRGGRGWLAIRWGRSRVLARAPWGSWRPAWFEPVFTCCGSTTSGLATPSATLARETLQAGAGT